MFLSLPVQNRSSILQFNIAVQHRHPISWHRFRFSSFMAASFLSRWLRRASADPVHRCADPAPWKPGVRSLEPRWVLNASAELNPLGQLVLIGTGLEDSVRIEFGSDETIQIFDESDPANPGRVVPIAGHPAGVGNESVPLATGDIAAGQLRVNLGPGNDRISLPLLGSLDVVVLGESGFDTTELQLDPNADPATGRYLIVSDQIALTANDSNLSLGSADVQLIGAVRLDSNLLSPQLQVGNQLAIIGPTTLSSSLTLVGSGLVDLDESVVSADADDVTLRIAMDAGSVRFGQVDASGGELLQSIVADSGASVRFGGDQVAVSGLIVADGTVGSIVSQSEITASSLDLQADQISITANILTSGGDLRLTVNDQLTLSNQAELFSANDQIVLTGTGSASQLDAADAILRSDASSNAITVSGFQQVRLGDTFAERGLLQLGTSGMQVGDVQQSLATSIVVDRLAGSSTGDVELANPSNDIRLVTELLATGNLRLADGIDDLSIDSMSSISGNIDVVAAGGLTVGRITANGSNASSPTTGPTMDQSIQLTADRIQDASSDLSEGDTPGVDLIADRILLFAQNGIGASAGLELMDVSEVTATTATDDVTLTFFGETSVVVQNVTTTDGNVTLVSNGVAADLLIDQIDVSGDGRVTLQSNDDILAVNEASLIRAQELLLRSANQTADETRSIQLRTDVDDLAASVIGPHRGDLMIDNIDANTPLRLAGLVDPQTGTVDPIQTANGQIILQSAGSIQVVDLTAGDAGADRKLDPEIVANGPSGRVDLESGLIALGDDVQIHASQVFQIDQPRPLGQLTDATGNRDQRAIFITADEVRFGDNIELFTGEDQGTARQFLSRPVSGISETQPPLDGSAAPGNTDAFFDPTSVRTNVLTQALQNDATGILSVNVGTPGERGLTVTIDWGDSDLRRFQQVDNLSADQNAFVGVDASPEGQPTATRFTDGDGAVDFTHLYLENDTLDSRSNGRTAATDPYNVRFAVRHHDSIVVQARTEGESALLSQNGITEIIDGGLISSTDNPATSLASQVGPALETGTATFIIPNLTIPVAFFPVRDVVPEFEIAQVVVAADTPIEFTTQTLEAVEAPVSSVVSREEYFQLRILSPDPDGEDLAPPEKLPSEIFDGQRLRRLFSQLPDGTYEIQKVIGDGNERTILQVEVRAGEATIPDDDLDEGVLRLIPLTGDGELPEEQNSNAEPSEDDDARERDPSPNDHASDGLGLFPSDQLEIMATGAAAMVAMVTTEPFRLSRFRNRLRMQGLASVSPTLHRSRLSRGRRFAKRRDG